MQQPLLQAGLADLDEWTLGHLGRSVRWPKLRVEVAASDFFEGQMAARLPDPDPEELGQQVRQARDARNMTQAQVAGDRFHAGIHRRTGEGQSPPLAHDAEHIAERLRTTRQALVADDPNRPPSAPRARPVIAERVELDGSRVNLALTDGRELGLPRHLFPKLRKASLEEFGLAKIVRDGAAVRWSNLGFEILVADYAKPRLDLT